MEKPEKKTEPKLKPETEHKTQLQKEKDAEPKRFKLFCWRSAIVCFEVSAVLAVLVALVAGVTVWRLTSGPVDISFTKEFIQEKLRDPERGNYAEMDQIVLYWPDLKGPVLLGLRGGKVMNKQGETLVSVDEAALSISIAKLFLGQVTLKTLILKKPTLRVIRTKDGRIDVGFGGAEEENAADEAQEDRSDIVERIVQYIARPGDEVDESSPLATLQGLTVQEAQVLVEDHILGISWFLPRFDVSLASTRTGLHSSLYLDLPDVDGEKAFIKGAVDFVWDSKDVSVNISVQNFDVHILAGKIPELPELDNLNVVLNGDIEAKLGPDLKPVTASVHLSSPEGSFYVRELSADPIPYKDFIVLATYDDAQQKLDVSQLQITAKDVTVKAQAVITKNEKIISGPVTITIDDLPQANIGPLWPDALKDDNSKTWVVDNITGGTYTHASAVLDVIAVQDEQGEWSVDVKDVVADFEFEDMSVNYRPPLTAVTAAKGKGHFSLAEEKLSVTVEKAKLADMDITGAEVELINIIKAGAGVADVHVKLSGPIRSALLYASKEPINLGEKIKFDVGKVKGHADLKVGVSLPTVANVQMEQVTIDIGGTVKDVYVPDVLQGLPLTGGPLTLKIDNEAARIAGKGKLNDRPVVLTWMEYLDSKGKSHSGKITAKITADPDLRRHFGIILDEFLAGSVPVDVTYTEFSNGTANADIKVDMTPARFFAEPFDYEKPAGVEGSANLRAMFNKGVLTEVRDLTGVAPGFKLESSTLTFQQKGDETQLRSGNISRFTMGETVAALEFEIEPTGRIKISLNGPVLDLRPFLNKDEEKKTDYDSPPVVVSVAVDQMRTADGESVQYGKIYADIDNEGHFNQLELDAIVGKGDIYLRFKPDETGKRVFRLEADDAGAALKAFQVYDKVVGGKMSVYAEPIRGIYDRNLIGLAQITDFKVVKAPALAQLLGAMSLVGIVDLLGNEGVSFAKMEADIDWLYRPQGSLVVFKNGRTSGNSLGLTFEGVYDKGEGDIDVSGTIVPLSGINEIIGAIPLLGDILTGGSGGVFAATYTVKGKAEEPEIFVNPLSVLAPGILRSILFE